MRDMAQSVIDQRDSLLKYGPAYKAATLVSFAAEFAGKLADLEEELLFDRALLMTLRCGIEDAAFMEGLASEVAPWLVGLADPIRERVEGRRVLPSE